MAKIVRFTGDLLAFAINALAQERTIFGDTSQSDTLDDNLNTDFFRGMGIVGINDFPTRQDFNAAIFTPTQLLAYLHQIGIPEWDSLQEFHLNSMTNFNGRIYTSLQNDNTGNNPDSEPDFWRNEKDSSNTPMATAAGGLNVNVSAGKIPIARKLEVASITRVGILSLLTTVADHHGVSVGERILVNGADQAGYNLDVVVLATPTPKSLSYEVDGGTPTPATGAIEMLAIETFQTIVDVAADTVTIDPSALTSDQQRIDVIYFIPAIEATGTLLILEGTPTKSIAEPPVSGLNDAVVAFVRVLFGQTEILQSDIMTDFDLMAVHLHKSVFIRGNVLNLAPPSGLAIVSARSRGGFDAAFDLYNDRILSSRFLRDTTGAHIENRLGSPNNIELSLLDTGELRYDNGLGSAVLTQLLSLESVTSGAPAAAGDVSLVTRSIYFNEFFVIMASARGVASNTGAVASLEINVDAGMLIEPDSPSVYTTSWDAAPSKAQSVNGLWKVSYTLADIGARPVEVEWQQVLMDSLTNFNVTIWKGRI